MALTSLQPRGSLSGWPARPTCSVFAAAVLGVRRGLPQQPRAASRMWFIFPLKGLGFGRPTAQHFGIGSLGGGPREAHQLLGPRLRDCTALSAISAQRSPMPAILGSVDALAAVVGGAVRTGRCGRMMRTAHCSGGAGPVLRRRARPANAGAPLSGDEGSASPAGRSRCGSPSLQQCSAPASTSASPPVRFNDRQRGRTSLRLRATTNASSPQPGFMPKQQCATVLRAQCRGLRLIAAQGMAAAQTDEIAVQVEQVCRIAGGCFGGRSVELGPYRVVTPPLTTPKTAQFVAGV